MTVIQHNESSSSNNEQLPLGSGCVDSKEQVSCLPPHLVSNDPQRSLKHYTNGTTYHYALKPLWYSAIFILLIEMLERFSYYGISNSQTAYLMGAYNPDWNANMTATSAVTFVSTTQGIAYTLPFLGGILADGFLGDYWGILLGTSLFYIPGLLLIALTSYPYLLGPTFDYNTLVAGMLVLYPLGAGFIKSVVNVFGAKQYHPTLQQPMIEQYYINFYMIINIGALAGGLLIPILAQFNVAIAYTIPVCALTLGLFVFILGSSRYVRHQPNKDALWKTLQLIFKRTAKCQPLEEAKKKKGGALENNFVDGVKQLLYVAPITALTIPFNIAYNQMSTVFVIQGSAMAKAGTVIDASIMTNVDPLSVLIFGTLVGSGLYPVLAKRGIHIPITYKFAIGTVLGAMSILSAIAVDYAIHNHYIATGEPISILWTTFNYLFVGAGEIFAITAAYDAAFSIAPKEQKGLASAINLFLIGGLPNFICIALYNSCKQWFPSGSGTITLEEYSQSQLYLYLWVLFGICMAGIIINLLPPVKNWVERIHQGCIKNAMDHQSAVTVTTASTNDDVCSQDKDVDVEGQSSTEDEDVVESMEDIKL